MRKALLIIICVVALIVAATIYFFYDPSQPGTWFPRCIFLTLTGYKCAGCGSQRAIHALLHGDVLTALHYNAALLVALPLVAAYGIAEWKREAWPRTYLAINNRWVVIAILVVLIAWWIGRNIAGI